MLFISEKCQIIVYALRKGGRFKTQTRHKRHSTSEIKHYADVCLFGTAPVDRKWIERTFDWLHASVVRQLAYDNFSTWYENQLLGLGHVEGPSLYWAEGVLFESNVSKGDGRGKEGGSGLNEPSNTPWCLNKSRGWADSLFLFLWKHYALGFPSTHAYTQTARRTQFIVLSRHQIHAGVNATVHARGVDA